MSEKPTLIERLENIVAMCEDAEFERWPSAVAVIEIKHVASAALEEARADSAPVTAKQDGALRSALTALQGEIAQHCASFFWNDVDIGLLHCDWRDRISSALASASSGDAGTGAEGPSASTPDPSATLNIADVRLVADYAMKMADPDDVENAGIRVLIALDGGIEHLKATAKPLPSASPKAGPA